MENKILGSMLEGTKVCFTNVPKNACAAHLQVQCKTVIGCRQNPCCFQKKGIAAVLSATALTTSVCFHFCLFVGPDFNEGIHPTRGIKSGVVGRLVLLFYLVS